MSDFQKRSRLPVSAQAVFNWHARPGAFERLIPPWETIRILEQSGGIGDGARVVLSLKRGPVWLRWEARHSDYVEGRQFVDEQVAGPFTRWRHLHRFEPDGPDGSFLDDTVEYELPLGGVGSALGGGSVAHQLERMFEFRHRRTRNDLVRQARHSTVPPQRIVISGASGLVGSHLTPFLTTAGHRVDALVRRAPAVDSTEIAWDPAAGNVDAAKLEGADAVIHLAGENVAGGSWTATRKAAIKSSRVDSTALLCQTIAAQSQRPRTLICASAIGIYGDRGNEELDEASAAGAGFLADTCKEWEAATEPARAAGIRVVNLRIGIVLSPKGGALQKLLTPFSVGAGGVVGTGRQYMSWIALDDLIGLIWHALFTPALSGPVNAVAPTPVPNAEFVKTLGRVLRRPTAVPLPAIAVKLLFGEMGQTLLLGGSRVLPTAARSAGFEFLHPSLEDALRAELGLYSPTT